MTTDKEKTVQHSKPKKGKDRGRIVGTSVVVVLALIAFFAAATVLFYMIAAFLQGDWLNGVIALVVLVFLFMLLNRLIRVAANQQQLSEPKK